MATEYKLVNDIKYTENLACIHNKTKNIFIPLDEKNTDYQEYLLWVADGNTAEAAD